MEIRENVIVPLGYGKYVRADKIIALEPIEDDRGPGRRTMVYIEQLPNPVIASRTEHSIVENMVPTPKSAGSNCCPGAVAGSLRHSKWVCRTSIKKKQPWI